MEDRQADVKRELCRIIAEDGEARWKVPGGQAWLTAPNKWPAFDISGTYLVSPVPKARYQNGYMRSDGTLRLAFRRHSSRKSADEFAASGRTHILIIEGDDITVEKV